MRSKVKYSTLLSMICLAVVTGCGGGAASMVEVKGTVKINGKQISEEGYVLMFSGKSKQGGNSTITVNADGTFSGEAPAGECSVDLINQSKGHAQAESGKKSKEQTEFSLDSVEVKAGEELELDFQAGGGGTSGGH
ncbi:MAG: hypothetical protein Tsb009_04950 [Planctomycetaceae bacterium]